MSANGRKLADGLGILLQRRLRTDLHADVVDGVHEAIDLGTYPIISAVARAGAVSASELGVEIGIDRSLASRRAASLVAAGLLEVSPDPDDRRAMLLELTDEGRRVVTVLRANLTAAIDSRLRSWSSADRRELARLFTRFVDDLTDSHDDNS